MENKTLTDEIYAELADGLKTGLNWTQFLAKYGASKGPLYNAIGRFFHDMEPELRALNEVQTQLDQAGLKLDSLDQKINEADQILQAKNHDIAALEDKENTLKKHVEALESDMVQKTKLLDGLQELEKLRFSHERLKALHTALIEIGTKRGLKRDEALNTFFAELKDYDAVQGFTQEIQRLDAIIGTKRLEAEKWEAQAENLQGRYRELEAAIEAIQSLRKQGVKPEHIVSWNNVSAAVGGIQELDKGLNRYGSIEKLLAAKKRERKRLDTKVAELNGKLDTLKEQKVELEGSIKALRASAIAEIERLSQTALETLRAQKAEIEGSIKTLKTSALNEMKEVSQTGVEKIGKVAQAGSDSLRQTGQTALSELKLALSLVDDVSDRALEVGKIIGQIESKLDESKETKKKTEALVARIEARR